MRICQVTPGIIEIPPKGWGAIEKIIWNYKILFESMGHSCDIKFLNDVNREDYDIIHIHVANLAIEAHRRNIPYVFSIHDHHVYRFGKKSHLYELNLEAIKKSIISFTHAEFLADYFDSTDKLFYLPHGVNTSVYKMGDRSRKIEESGHRLICVANNGYSDDQSYDRKGFRVAIESARDLGLPITIVGPENNINFFESNGDLLDYSGLNLVLKNPSEEEMVEILSKHSIFLHPSELEAGHPNLTILEAVSCGLPVVGTYNGSIKIDALVKCTREKESVLSGVREVISSYDIYLDHCKNQRDLIDWSVICEKILNLYKILLDSRSDINSEIFRKKTDNFLKNVPILKIPKRNNIRFNINHINGSFCEIVGNGENDYRVEFLNPDGNIEYSSVIGCNMWSRLNKKYYSEHTVRVFEDDQLIFEEKYNARGKRVFITLESKAIGDTLAWIPYVEQFRIKNGCHVICSTFWNPLFAEVYPEIEFVNPGSVVTDLYAMYNIGWFYDPNRDPNKPGSVPLQQTASDILGLDFKEVRPRLLFNKEKRPIPSKYVTIGTASTAGCKEWDRVYWQSLVNSLIEMGYQVAVIQKTPTDLEGVLDWTGDVNLTERMNQIYHSDFYVGLGSGISWLAWAVGKHVFMIANFSEDGHEFTENTTRITNKSVCNSCWNNPNFKFDKGDWFWCPVNKGTPRQFECQRSITPSMVLQKIKEYTNG